MMELRVSNSGKKTVCLSINIFKILENTSVPLLYVSTKAQHKDFFYARSA
jgi:hypothetical protein